jgi:hypothetical protein
VLEEVNGRLLKGRETQVEVALAGSVLQIGQGNGRGRSHNAQPQEGQD